MPASNHRSDLDKRAAGGLMERDLLFNTLDFCFARDQSPGTSAEGGKCSSLDTLSSVTACLLLHRNGQSAGAQCQAGAS